jgi:hypothetical protein
VKAEPASDEHVWWTGLRWVEAAHMQVWRFDEAFGEEMSAEADAHHRRQLNDDSGISESWRRSYDEHHERYDPQRPIRVPSWALQMQSVNELDLLAVAIRNVLRAQERIPERQRPEMGDQDALELIRNVSEHWDEVGGRSADELAVKHPRVDAGQIAFTNKEIWIGGEHGVPLSRITAWLLRVQRALLACLANAGIEAPDPRASQIEDDDDLPWPPERLRFHWSIPRVEEQDWPRRKMPDDVAEALALIFARRRARDHTD